MVEHKQAHSHVTQGFMNEKSIEEVFRKKLGTVDKSVLNIKDSKNATFAHWYLENPQLDQKLGIYEILYAHSEDIDGTKISCDSATDEWYRWFLTTPRSKHPMLKLGNADDTEYGVSNAFSFQLGNASIYFATASPFQEPDFRRVIVTRKSALLVPVYNVIASNEMFPGATDQTCLSIVKEDLIGIKPKEITATFDDKSIYGCCVIRTEPLEISGIPKDNIIGIPEERLAQIDSKIKVYHGGFWLLIREKALTPGDHLLAFCARSKNYEINVKMLITSLIEV
jgi:hypothetical protein